MRTSCRTPTRRRVVSLVLAALAVAPLLSAPAFAQGSPPIAGALPPRACPATPPSVGVGPVIRRIEMALTLRRGGEVRTLDQRMRALKVPGVSVALIREGRLA